MLLRTGIYVPEWVSQERGLARSQAIHVAWNRIARCTSRHKGNEAIGRLYKTMSESVHLTQGGA